MACTDNENGVLNENGELQTDFKNLSSKFRRLRNTISNKHSENIISELELKTQELEALSGKLNWEELKQNHTEQPLANSTKIRELECKIEDQNLIICQLELEKSAILSDNQFLKQELTKMGGQIEKLNSQFKTHPTGENHVKVPLKDDKYYLGNIKRAQTFAADIDWNPKVIPAKHNKRVPFAKHKSTDRYLTPNQLPTIQNDLANPQPRPLSPRPIQRRFESKVDQECKSIENTDDTHC